MLGGYIKLNDENENKSACQKQGWIEEVDSTFCQSKIEIFNKDNKESEKTRNKLMIKYDIECVEEAKDGAGLLRKIN